MTSLDLNPGRRVLRDLLLEHAPSASAQADFPPDPILGGLAASGTSLWLDTGDLEAAGSLWCKEMAALTTNNSLLNAEIQKGLYDQEVPAVAAAIKQAEPEISPNELVREVGLYLNGRHGMKLVETFNAMVSVELHTDLAQELEKTYTTGLFLHSLCPDRFIIKTPFTPAGVLATRKLAAAGIPVNHTLGFSARQNLVIAAIGRPAYVNIFLGRLNAYASGNNLGDGKLVGEKVTWASQKVLLDLREKGWPTRQIAASIRSGEQLEDLAGLDVHTIPPAAAVQYRENNPTPPTSKLNQQWEINIADGIDQDKEGLTALWEIDEQLRQGVMDIATAVTDQWTPAQLENELRKVGGGAIFPQWTKSELERIAADGKAPLHDQWATEIGNGSKGLDALFTQAGLLAFAKDQAALDQRVKGLLT